MSVILASPGMLGRIMGGATSLLNPINDIVSYAVPKAGPYFSGTWEVNSSENLAVDNVILLDERRLIVKEIDELVKAVGLGGDVALYTGQKCSYASFGGDYSFTRPVIQVPFEHLHRNQDLGAFGDQQNETALAADTWRYTDSETRFLILRELTQIKTNDSFLKLIARVVMISAAVLFKMAPMTWPISLALFGAALLIHFLIDRIVNGRSDALALNSLIKVSKSPEEACSVALNVLKKEQQQNLYHKGQGRIANLLIDKQGDERFNFLSPSLSKRIERLEKATIELAVL